MSKNVSNHTSPTRKDRIIFVSVVMPFLLAILSGAGALRFTHLNWDEDNLLHPDDRFMAWVAADISFSQLVVAPDGEYSRQMDVDSPADYFDTLHTSLNPNNVGHGFYVYGDLPVLLTRLAAERAEAYANRNSDEIVSLTSIYDTDRVGRALAALADWFTILFVFLAARCLFDNRIGLLAAGLYAFAAFPIQQSHFFTADPFANLFTMAAFWFAVRTALRHRWLDYVLFGLALGLAMASKISVAPLALILIAALGLRLRRNWRASPGASDRVTFSYLLSHAAAGLAIAGLVTVLTFRLAMPYAFLPVRSPLPVDSADLGTGLAAVSHLLNPLGFRPNPNWVHQMHEVRFQVSGYADSPPNHQWAHRSRLLFPWLNMVRVGLGWPLGVFAWLAVVWSLWEIVRRHRRSDRLVLPVLWTLLMFIWQGAGWVTTMRYFLPIYGTLLMLAAWAMVTLSDRVGALIERRRAPTWHWSRWLVMGLSAVVVLSGLLWGLAVYHIYTRPHTRVAASTWMVEHVPSDVTLILETDHGMKEVQLGLWNDWQPAMDSEEDDITRPAVQYTFLEAGIPTTKTFSLSTGGQLVGIRLYRVVDPFGGGTEHTLTLNLTHRQDPANQLTEGTIRGHFEPTPGDPRGQSYWVATEPVMLQAGTEYRLDLQPDPSGPLVVSGATVTNEDSWDDALPVRSVAPADLWQELYQGYTFQVSWADDAIKRQRLQYILDHTDYLVISSNRFYAALSRNPQRWPLTLAYYQALFEGDLGFDLVADFTSRPTLGPIHFRDDSAEEAWTVYDHPRVFIFQKTAAYSPERTAAILDRVDLNAVVSLVAIEAQGRPISLPLP